jgi:hypothetical protein
LTFGTTHILGGGGDHDQLVVKLALTSTEPFSVTTHVPMRVWQLPPDQYSNHEPEAAVAVSVNWVPSGAVTTQAPAGQSIPAGLLVTVPEPGPEDVTVSVAMGSAKIAVTVVSLFSVTLHNVRFPNLPGVQPLHPPGAKNEPGSGVSARVIGVPAANAYEQAPAGQSIPAGLLVTVPEPVPASVIVRVYWVESLCTGSDFAAESSDDPGRGSIDKLTPAPDLAEAAGTAITAPAIGASASSLMNCTIDLVWPGLGVRTTVFLMIRSSSLPLLTQREMR